MSWRGRPACCTAPNASRSAWSSLRRLRRAARSSSRRRRAGRDRRRRLRGAVSAGRRRGRRRRHSCRSSVSPSWRARSARRVGCEWPSGSAASGCGQSSPRRCRPLAMAMAKNSHIAQVIGHTPGRPTSRPAPGMPGSATLALVTVSFNSAAVLGALLDSAARHLPGVRVIVVDCGSSDDSVGDRPRHPAAVSVPAGANLGFGAGSNLGLTHVVEPVTVFVNPDVELVDDSLQSLAAGAGCRRTMIGCWRRWCCRPPGAPGHGPPRPRARPRSSPGWSCRPVESPGPLGTAIAPWRSRRPRPVGWAVACALARPHRDAARARSLLGLDLHVRRGSGAGVARGTFRRVDLVLAGRTGDPPAALQPPPPTGATVRRVAQGITTRLRWRLARPPRIATTAGRPPCSRRAWRSSAPCGKITAVSLPNSPLYFMARAKRGGG